MSLEVLSTGAALGTFIVIAATAIAAVVQLRHLRASNQLQGLLNVLARAEDAKFNEWIDRSRRILAENMPDSTYRRRIIDGTFDRTDNPWLNLANSYEWMGSLIRQGLIPEAPFMDVHGGRIMGAWRLIEEIIAIRRRQMGPRVWENFEYIFMRAASYDSRHPHVVYPRTTPRAKLNDKWLAADTAAS